jgi:tripartite-type tricarboxylate transporter receptor subunit TctC
MHRVVMIAACALLVALVDRSASAQPYPNRAVRIVVPFAVDAPDAVARLLSQRIAAQLGQPVVVDNRPGANGIIGTQLVATSAPDGYTLLLVSASIAVNPSVQKRLPYDPVKDLSPITTIGSTEALILGVNPSLPASSVRELIAFARRPDSRLSYGSPGVGNTTHLAGELFKARTGIEMVHVPYKGAGPAIAAFESCVTSRASHLACTAQTASTTRW